MEQKIYFFLFTYSENIVLFLLAMLLPKNVESSFFRCINLGLRRNDPLNDEILSPKILNDLKKENRSLIENSIPVMEKIYPFLKTAGHVAILTDNTGNILLSLGEAESLTRMQRFQLQPGANWMEEKKGTNAIGTAIIEKLPIRVHAGEHFLNSNDGLTCSASPILSADGRIIGVIDISGIYQSEISYALSLASMAAENIQTRMLMESYKEELSKKKFQIQIPCNTTSKRVSYSFSDIYADCEKMKTCITIAKKASRTDYTILLEGETGTGKEAFAQSIHGDSARREFPFVAINCSSIPESLIESELFGYIGGAFTGSNIKGNTGKFQAANGGTLFLDEISGMNLRVQAALLRAVQERKVTPVGSTKEIPIDVRIIAAANQSLEKQVREGTFRSDLYYRLKGITISLPAVRNRTDLEGLVGDVLSEIENGNNYLDKEAWNLVKSYKFPGNIRELHSIMLQASFQAEEGHITKEIIQNILFSNTMSEPYSINAEIDNNFSLRDTEKSAILTALDNTKGNLSKAAKLLKIGRTTLYRKMQEFGLSN
jgi:sigma-54 dependent transcriptional regulator, acetoin dehydrogenase operon transcriptional activator AcoR